LAEYQADFEQRGTEKTYFFAGKIFTPALPALLNHAKSVLARV
jgi:hypothetical protein